MAELTLTEAENGGRFDVRVSDTIAITLPESSGGYRWDMVAIDENHLTVQSRRYEPSRAGVGSAGTDGWRLVARRPGHTRVELKKSRTWEADPIGRFSVDLEITEG